MDSPDELDRRFREATLDLRVEPVRWDRVARRTRRRAVLVALVAALATGALTAVLAGGVLVGKSAVDSSFPPLFADRHAGLSVAFDEAYAARGHTRLGRFLTETRRSAAGLSPRQLREEGFAFKLDARLVGYGGARLLPRWSVLDAQTGQVVPVPFHMLDVPVTPHGARQDLPLRFWVPYPPRRGTYVVRFSLAEVGTGEVVAERSSPPFFARPPGDFVEYRTPRYVAELPRDWKITQDFKAVAGRFVSVAKGPGGVSVLIDTTPGFEGSSAAGPRKLDAQNRRVHQDGYRRLVFEWETLGTGPAFEWSFVVDGRWVTDVFFVRGHDGYAVLADGPASRYSETRVIARNIARSLRSRFADVPARTSTQPSGPAVPAR